MLRKIGKFIPIFKIFPRTQMKTSKKPINFNLKKSKVIPTIVTITPSIILYKTFFDQEEKKPSLLIKSEEKSNKSTSQASSFNTREQFEKYLTMVMQQVNLTPRDQSGVWYYDDYANYCLENQSIFNKDYETGYANPDYWEKTERFEFKLKKGKKPSEALRAFLSGFTVADCGNILVACYYAALLSMMGDEKFNLIFSNGDFKLKISQRILDPTYAGEYFFDHTEKSKLLLKGIIGDRPIEAGDKCHISGLRYYAIKHPAGNCGGWNVICVGKNDREEDIFIGFGPTTFSSRPLTENELYKIFIDHYNLERNIFDEELIMSDNTPVKYNMEAHCIPEKVNYDDALKDINGFSPGSVIRPNFSRIEKIINTPASKVLDVFKSDYALYLSERIRELERMLSNGDEYQSSSLRKR